MSEKDEDLRRAADAALANAAEPEAARNALAFLFPKFDRVLKTYIPTKSTDQRGTARSRRISVSDFAPAYFRMDPQHATWSRPEIEQFISNPQDAFSSVENRLRAFDETEKPRLRRLFLDDLRSLFQEEAINEQWFRAIIDASPTYITARDEVRRIFVEDNAERLRHIVYAGLRPLEPADRAKIFLDVIPHADDISLLCDLVRLIAGDVRADSREREPAQVTFGENADAVRKALLKRVINFSASGRLWKQADLSRILWFWWGSDPGDGAKHFTTDALNADRGVRQLLNVPVSRVYSTSGDYDQVARYWEQIVDIDRLADIARGWIDNPERPEEDRQLATRYLMAYERKDRFGR